MKDKEREFKHKLCKDNAFLLAKRPRSASECSQRGTSSVPYRPILQVCSALILVPVQAGSARAGAVQSPRQPLDVRCYGEAHLDAPQRSIKLAGQSGLLFKRGQVTTAYAIS